MTLDGVADNPATPVGRDLLGAAPIAVLRGAAAALAVAALGQVPPSLVNLAGGGLAVQTQVRVGWLYTMAGHAASVRATGSGGAVDDLRGVVDVRLGLLTITGAAVVLLAFGARATARRVGDVGVRRIVGGAMIAVPYALAIGVVNAGVILRLRTSGTFVPASTTIATPVWEGFALPAAIAIVTGAAAGWSTSWSRRTSFARACRSGATAFAWALGLSLVALLAFATLRPEGLERYAVEMTSGGPARAGLYAGHQALLLPNQSVWALAPAMGGCVSIRTARAAHDLVCLDRIPRGDDPATWFLSELGRVGGSPPTTPMPAAAWLSVAVPIGAIVAGFRHLGPTATTVPRAAGLGIFGGTVFAALVTVTALAGSLWLTTGAGMDARSIGLGPDPTTTALLALAWGVVGGAVVGAAGAWRVSRRGRPR